MPLPEIGADAIEDPLAKLQNQIAFFCDWNEIRWEYDAAFRKVPPNQCFNAGDAPVTESILGLVVESEFFVARTLVEACS